MCCFTFRVIYLKENTFSVFFINTLNPFERFLILTPQTPFSLNSSFWSPVAQGGLQLLLDQRWHCKSHLPASAPWVRGIQVCTITPAMQLMWCWRSWPGICAQQASTLPTELLPQSILCSVVSSPLFCLYPFSSVSTVWNSSSWEMHFGRKTIWFMSTEVLLL